ncbi:MAG TPA: hypothetical protein VGO46_03025 [Gemmatimonadaceae bacterium]|nr:hypothetical protein [Gemmatimonadaceae bacterium]
MSLPTATSRSTPPAELHPLGSSEPDGRIPVVIGVTGHRSLRAGDEDAITARIRTLLTLIKSEAPNTPVVLLSALAEGADRLVARVAVREGTSLIAVLPLEQSNYETDFADTRSRDDFRVHLADPRTEQCIIAPQLDAAVVAPGGARDLQYLLAGLYIARNSDVLIALWDGTPARGVGGTADIVEFRRTGLLDFNAATCEKLANAPDPFRIVDAPLDAPQTGLVYHIPVSRSNGAPSTDPSTGGWLIPSSFDATPDLRARFLKSSLSTLRRRDELNREGAEYRAHRGGRVAASNAMLTAGQTTPSTRDAGAPRALASTRATFAIADSLAIEHQKSIYRTIVALFGMIAVATISLVMRNIATSDDARRICLAGYLLLLTLADLAYLRTRWRKSQDRFQDYRALAEGLRVQFFWRLGGSRRAASDYYLRKQRSELRWIRDVLRVCALRAEPLAAGDYPAVQRLWVKDQRAYYDRAADRDGQRRRRQRSIGSALALLSLAATIKWLWDFAEGRIAFIAIAAFAALVLAAHAVYEIVNAMGEAESPTTRSLRDMISLGLLSVAVALAFYATLVVGGPKIMSKLPQLSIGQTPLEWMLAAIGITALVGTFAHAYANVRAFGEHQKQYERMEELFLSADEALDRAESSAATADADRVLFDLGCEALAEHADWLILHRARPIELPKAEL